MPLYVHQAASTMWDDLGMDYEMAGQELNPTALSYFHHLLSPGPIPKRIPPGLRCPISQNQHAGWKLFQKTNPEDYVAALNFALEELPGPDAAGFLELMIANDGVDKIVETLESLWGKSTKRPPEGQPPFLMSSDNHPPSSPSTHFPLLLAFLPWQNIIPDKVYSNSRRQLIRLPMSKPRSSFPCG